MKPSIKIIVAAAFAGTLGFGGFIQTVYAAQSRSQVAIMPQQHSSDENGEANDATSENAHETSDGDRETDDARQEHNEAAQLQSLAKVSSQQAQ